MNLCNPARLILSWCLLLAGHFAAAQDLVLKAPARASYAYMPYTLDTTDMSEGADGPGQLWDFSATRIADSGILCHFASIDNTPYRELYPRANFAISNDLKSIISFLYGNEDMIALCGDVDFYHDVYVRKVEGSGLDTQLLYPAYYGMKPWRSKKYYTVQRSADSSFARIWLSKQSEADASGTVITPDHQEFKVVRVVFKEHQETKVYRMNDTGKVYWYYQVNRTTNTFWLCPEMPYLYLVYHCRSFVDVTGPGLKPVHYSTEEARYNKPSGSTATPDYNSANLHVTKDLINTVYVRYTTQQPGPGVLQIIDIGGSTVVRLDVNSDVSAPAENEQQLNASGLAPGVYIITYYSATDRGVTKWVKK